MTVPELTYKIVPIVIDYRERTMIGNDHKKLTNFQESILHFMMLYERLKRDVSGTQGECTFSSAFFQQLLGVTWQGYHNQMMDDLARLGWITIKQPSGRARFFRLTDIGRSALREHYASASLYVWYI